MSFNGSRTDINAVCKTEQLLGLLYDFDKESSFDLALIADR